MRELFILIPFGLLCIAGGCIYVALSSTYLRSAKNFGLVVLGALCGLFLYWAVWLGELVSVNIPAYIASVIWHTEPGKVPEGATRWDAILFVVMAPVFAAICDVILLKLFGVRKTETSTPKQ